MYVISNLEVLNLYNFSILFQYYSIFTIVFTRVPYHLEMEDELVQLLSKSIMVKKTLSL